MELLRNYFKDWTKWEIGWLSIFTAVIVGLSIYWGDTLMGITCSLTGIWCVVLVAKGRISNYWIGIINVVLYAIIAYGQKYYGEVMLNAFYFLPMQFIGAYVWIKNKDNTKIDSVKAKVMTWKQRITWTVISVVGILGYGYFLQTLGGNMPYVDSMSTVLSVLAMYLMVTRYAEQWIMWIIVDLASIVLWVVALMNGGNDIAVLLMWVAYTINAFYGWFNWIKMSKLQEA